MNIVLLPDKAYFVEQLPYHSLLEVGATPLAILNGTDSG
jgi:hypothetical protein